MLLIFSVCAATALEVPVNMEEHYKKYGNAFVNLSDTEKWNVNVIVEAYRTAKAGRPSKEDIQSWLNADWWQKNGPFNEFSNLVYSIAADTENAKRKKTGYKTPVSADEYYKMNIYWDAFANLSGEEIQRVNTIVEAYLEAIDRYPSAVEIQNYLNSGRGEYGDKERLVEEISEYF
jgi:hypothetical protein